MPDYVEEALVLPGGYSEKFSEQVAKIGNIISSHLGFPILHDKDMNYRAGQSLSFSLSGRPPYAPSRNGCIEIDIYISSRSELYCFFCRDSQIEFIGSNESGFFVKPELFPVPVQEIVSTCRNILNSMGFKEVENALLNLKIPNFFTELDNLPATVFEILFSEI